MGRVGTQAFVGKTRGLVEVPRCNQWPRQSATETGGRPGIRVYAAFIRDLDGNRIESVTLVTEQG